MRKQNNVRPSVSSVMVWVRMAVVLMCLVVLSMQLMSGLLAKYRTSGGASDGARVAAFHVDVTGQVGNTTISAVADQGVYTVNVDNALSDVAINYDIVIQFAQAAPGVTVKLGDTVGVVSSDLKTVTFANVGILAAHGEISHILNFSVSNWGAFTQDLSGSSATVELNFTVTVDVRQVD